MNVDKNDVIFSEIARICDGFNGAQLKAVCIEAGMNALKRDSPVIVHEDYIEGIKVVQAKKKSDLIYYA